jgi:hypothetical protein
MGKRFAMVWAAVAVMSSTASAQAVFSGEVTAGTITVESVGLTGAIGTLDLAGPGFHLVGMGAGIILGNRDTTQSQPGATVDMGAFLPDGATGVSTVHGETRNPAFFTGGDGRGIELYAGEAHDPEG